MTRNIFEIEADIKALRSAIIQANNSIQRANEFMQKLEKDLLGTNTNDTKSFVHNRYFYDYVEQLAGLLGYKVEELNTKARPRYLVEARQIISLFLYKKGVTLEAIGKVFNRDHSTIINNKNELINLMSQEHALKLKYLEFERKAQELNNEQAA